MKSAPVVGFLSVSVMLLAIFQAVRQEVSLRSLKTRMAEGSLEVKRREEAIVQLKAKVEGLNKELPPFNTKKSELLRKKGDFSKSMGESDKNLETCKTEKTETEKKKSSQTEAIAKLKADHEEAKKKAQEEIQGLKQQILDRDKAICTFVNATNEEGRKLCGLAETPK
ncbi:uncharacterized protein si:dkey-87o1.2 [Lampris incognitus]|uniref:uncharacterized protein si:dkey-87o1.2 n=1 Tax=Lampris incognitus TaxID=2546036 RepID=UPI0024B61846|nr:uncharacterized protein si:dkey-87o1.2 [Lampris incognitus]